MVRFFFKIEFFHNSNLLGSCIVDISYTGCAKIKKKFRRQKFNDLPFFHLSFFSFEKRIFNSALTVSPLTWKIW